MHQADLSNSTIAPPEREQSRIRHTRRQVMLTAWSFRRSEPSRSFADCLCGAWKMIKRLAEDMSGFARRMRGCTGHAQLSPSLIRSPIQRSLTGMRYAGSCDYRAARLTGRLGY
jgi:hypothetical protein